MTNKGIPTDFHTLTPHLVIKNAAAAIEFYKKAFGAEEVCRMEMPGGAGIMHAQLRIGDSPLMLADEMEGGGCVSKSPLQLGGSPVTLHLYVEDVDKTFQKAITAGGQEIMAPADMFWGDRYGKLKDPFGHEWALATQVREMSQAEVQTAAAEFMRQPQPVG